MTAEEEQIQNRITTLHRKLASIAEEEALFVRWLAGDPTKREQRDKILAQLELLVDELIA